MIVCRSAFLSILAVITLSFTGAVSGAGPAYADRLPIDAFAMRPAIQGVSLSPDGKHLGLLRGRSFNGDYILEIFETRNLNRKPVRIASKVMELTGFYWLNNKRLWIDVRQKAKRGNSKWRYRSYIINSDGTGNWTLLPNEGNVSLMKIWRENPKEILLTYDNNDNNIPDVVKYNVNTGKKRTIFRGSNKLPGGFMADNDGEVRVARGFDINSLTIEYYARLKGSKDWKLVKKNPGKDRVTFEILGFDPERPNELFILANNGEDKASIYAMDIATGKYTEKLFGLKSADAYGILASRKPGKSGQLNGFTYITSKYKRIFIDEAEKALYDAVNKLFPHEEAVMISRSDDDNNIVVRVRGPKDAGTYYLLRNKSELSLIGSRFPMIKPEHLSKVKFVRYKARDGLKIPAYITIPKGEAPYPAVIMPHGGPWAQDFPGYDEWAQLLAHHGYLVIQPQFRGSVGFGLAHWKIGDKKWGLEMQDDLDDGMAYLVKKGLADENRMAMFGWSYGGYAAFVASMRENNIYKCTVAGAGVSDMSKISADIFDNFFSRKVQGPTVKGVSPIEHVDKVNIPIFVIHGDIDQRVNIYHSRAFVKKLKEFNKDYKYTELKGADHFSNTLFYDHKKIFYSELIDWLDNKCFK